MALLKVLENSSLLVLKLARKTFGSYRSILDAFDSLFLSISRPRPYDPCSVRIGVCMWMLVMFILFVDMALYARDMDIYEASCPYYAYVGSDWILYGTCFYVRFLGLWAGRPFSMVSRQAGLFVSAFCYEALFLECSLAPL